MTLPVQPAPHSASGRCISIGEDDVASPRAYPGDLVYDFAGIEIQNKDGSSGFCVGTLQIPPLCKGRQGGVEASRGWASRESRDSGKPASFLPPHPLLQMFGPESRVTGVPDTWVTHSDPSAQIELRDAMRTEPHGEDPIRLGRLHPHGVPDEGLRDPQGAPVEIEPPAQLDATHGHPTGVRDGRQRRREAAQARLVPGRGDRQGERVMRPLSVVGLPPAIEGRLAVGEVAPLLGAEELGLQRAVETLFLPLRLRVVGPTVADPDPPSRSSQTVNGV